MKKQIQLIELFQRWQANRKYNNFCTDGILVEQEFEKSTPKILVLLKESKEKFSTIQGPVGPNGDSPAFFRNIKLWTTNINKFINNKENILEDYLYIKEVPVDNIAYVNLKKEADIKLEDSQYSLDECIDKYTRNDAAFLIEQIEIIDPDIILCGGTFKYSHHLYDDFEKIGEKIYKRNTGQIWIDFYHPSCRKSYEETHKELKKIISQINLNSDSLQNEENKLGHFLDQYIEKFIETKPESVTVYIDKLRQQNPGISNDALAKKIKNRKAFKNGLVGAATGIPGIIALPITIPTDLIFSWKIQVGMVFSIAYIYGHTHDTRDLKTDLYLILAGNSIEETLKKFGIEVTKDATKKIIKEQITRETMKKINKYVSRKIITKAGEKSLTSFTKLVPLVGAPIGFGFDYFATRTVGKIAIHYYKS